MIPSCGRNGCLGRMRRLGEVDGVAYYECANGHFTRLTLNTAPTGVVEIAGCEVPSEISIVGVRAVED